MDAPPNDSVAARKIIKRSVDVYNSAWDEANAEIMRSAKFVRARVGNGKNVFTKNTKIRYGVSFIL